MKPLSDATKKLFLPIPLEPDQQCLLSVNTELTKFCAEFYTVDTDRGWKRLPTSRTMQFIERLPERKEVKKYTGVGRAYDVPATDTTVELFATLWPLEQLFFDAEDSRTIYEGILTRSLFADYAAEVVAQYKERGQVVQHGLEFCADMPLADYQQVGLHNAYTSPGFSLFMEQGTGKTPIGVAVICNVAAKVRAAENRMARVIVVCPKSVRANWENEFYKFATRAGKVTVLRGSEIGRVRQLIDAVTPVDGCEWSAVVCGYETLTRSIEAIGKIPWDVAILDESQYIKSSTTKRFAAACKLRDVSDKRIALTGTPIGNSVMDLYAQLEFCGAGYSGFSSFQTFRKFYGVYDEGNSADGRATLIGVQNLPFMQERLARYSFVVRKKDVLPDLPEKVYDIYEVEMQPTQSDFYENLATQLSVEIEAELTSDNVPREMQINNVLVKLLRLAQVTSGFVTWPEVVDESGAVVRAKHTEYFSPNPKIEALLDLLDGKPETDKTIVWATFQADIEYISHALKSQCIDHVTFYGATSDEDRRIAEWKFNNDPTCKVFVGNPAAGGTGLNLLGYPPGNPDNFETNCNHVIYFSQDWSYIKRAQSEDRANRRGTRVQTRITDLVTPATIDEEIRARVVGKQISALKVSDLREILQNVLKTN
jgi:SNF2 family DNA or RNA helicase